MDEYRDTCHQEGRLLKDLRELRYQKCRLVAQINRQLPSIEAEAHEEVGLDTSWAGAQMGPDEWSVDPDTAADRWKHGMEASAERYGDNDD
jgi:hypothetical protein